MSTIKNSSFEGGWTRDTYTGQEWPEIFVPEDWTAWWREGLPVPHDPANQVGYARPEMQVINKEPPFLAPPRILEGNRALKFFTFYKIHEAGLYQTIDTTPGTIYNLGASAHAWSSSLDDPYNSDGAPGAFSALEGTPGLSDAQRNFTFALGVDLTGGANPWDSTVAWGQGAHIYNVYDDLPTLGFVATGPRATVFIRSTVLWPLKHCDAYVDAVTLTASEPEPPECPPGPREQFKRTYNVIPADATEERAVAIFLEGWRRSRETAGGSYDDAGKWGGIDDATARLYDIPADRRQDFIDFYDIWYPGTNYVFAGNSPEPLPDVTAYSQRDPAWSYLRMLPSTATMGGSGCLVTDIAIYATLVDKAVTPGTLCLCLRENGGFTAEGGLIFAAVEKCLPYMDFRNYVLWSDVADMGVVAAALERGPTILKVDWDVSDPDIDSHFVWAYAWTDAAHTDIRCIDPWTGNYTTILTAYPRGTIAQSIKGIVDYAIVEDPEPPDPVAPIRPTGSSDSTILLHEMQTAPAGIPNFLQMTHPPAHLVVGNGGAPQLVQARALWPTALLCYRRVEDGLDVYNPAQAAEYVQRYIIDLQGSFNLSDFSRPPIYLVSINEKYECRHATQNAACAAWDIAFMTAIEATGLNLKGIVYTAPVGNPEPDAQDLDPLLPMVAKAVAGKHVLGKHCYYASVPADPTFYQDSGLWYQFRFKQDDDYFASKGLAPFWMLTEGGACQATVNADGTVSLNPGCGWVGCGSIQRYRDELLWCHAWYKNWNDTHGNRLLGVNLFTTGGWWPLFDLQGANLDVVTAGLSAVL